MFCYQCGTAIADDASFCHKCGKAVQLVDNGSNRSSILEHGEPLPPPVAQDAIKREGWVLPSMERFAPIKKRQAVLSILFLVLIYGPFSFSVLDGDVSYLAGHAKETVMMGAIGFYSLWKSFNRRGWVGVLVGVVVTLLMLFLSASIAGYFKGQRADILDRYPHFAALKTNFPEVAEKVRQDLRNMSEDKEQNRQEFANIFRARVLPALSGALKTTTDAAILQLAKAKIQSFQEIADSNAGDCVLLMSGEFAKAAPASRARVMAGFTKETNQALQDSFVKVLIDANAYRSAPPVFDEKRFGVLYNQLDVKLKSAYGTSAYYFSDNSLNKPATVRCKAGLLLFKEALNLPEKDRAFMLRALFAND